MSEKRKHFPVPTLWVWVFMYISISILCVLAYILKNKVEIQHQGLLVAGLALVIIPTVFTVFHKLGVYAESRGWLYYRKPRTAGIKAGVALDLEILMTARPTNQIENLRKASQAHNESAQQDGEGDKPPEKETFRHE